MLEVSFTISTYAVIFTIIIIIEDLIITETADSVPPKVAQKNLDAIKMIQSQ